MLTEDQVLFAWRVLHYAKRYDARRIHPERDEWLGELINDYKEEGGSVPDGDPIEIFRAAIEMMQGPRENDVDQYIQGIEDVLDSLDS